MVEKTVSWQKLWVETKACKFISVVSASGLLPLSSAVSDEQTLSGSTAPSNAQLSQWFLVQFCLDPTENVIYAQIKQEMVSGKKVLKQSVQTIALHLMF